MTDNREIAQKIVDDLCNETHQDVEPMQKLEDTFISALDKKDKELEKLRDQFIKETNWLASRIQKVVVSNVG